MRSIEKRELVSMDFVMYASPLTLPPPLLAWLSFFQQWQIQSTFYSTDHNDQTWQTTMYSMLYTAGGKDILTLKNGYKR